MPHEKYFSMDAEPFILNDKQSVCPVPSKCHQGHGKKERPSAVARQRTSFEIVQAHFETVASGSLSDGGTYLLTRRAPRQIVTTKLFTKSFTGIEEIFRVTIRSGQQLGDLNEIVDAEQVEALLMAAVNGRLKRRNMPLH